MTLSEAIKNTKYIKMLFFKRGEIINPKIRRKSWGNPDYSIHFGAPNYHAYIAEDDVDAEDWEIVEDEVR